MKFQTNEMAFNKIENIYNVYNLVNQLTGCLSSKQ